MTKASFSGRAGTSPNVITARRTIDVFVIEGRNLISIGGNRLCSPYVKLKFATNKKNRTQVDLTGNEDPFILTRSLFLDD